MSLIIAITTEIKGGDNTGVTHRTSLASEACIIFPGITWCPRETKKEAHTRVQRWRGGAWTIHAPLLRRRSFPRFWPALLFLRGRLSQAESSPPSQASRLSHVSNPCWEAAPTGRRITSIYVCVCPCVCVYKQRSICFLWELVAVHSAGWSCIMHWAAAGLLRGEFCLARLWPTWCTICKMCRHARRDYTWQTDVEFHVLSVDVFGLKDGILRWFVSQVTHNVLIFTSLYVNNLVRHQHKGLISRTIGFCVRFWKV